LIWIILIWANTSTGPGEVVYSCRVVVNECEPHLYAALIKWIRDRGLAVRGVTEPYDPGDVPTLSTQARFYSFVFL